MTQKEVQRQRLKSSRQDIGRRQVKNKTLYVAKGMTAMYRVHCASAGDSHPHVGLLVEWDREMDDNTDYCPHTAFAVALPRVRNAIRR
jgi:hypothetical protein